MYVWYRDRRFRRSISNHQNLPMDSPVSVENLSHHHQKRPPLSHDITSTFWPPSSKCIRLCCFPPFVCHMTTYPLPSATNWLFTPTPREHLILKTKVRTVQTGLRQRRTYVWDKIECNWRNKTQICAPACAVLTFPFYLYSISPLSPKGEWCIGAMIPAIAMNQFLRLSVESWLRNHNFSLTLELWRRW